MSGFYYQGVWRDILAAARSARAGDTQPLLRLAAETVTTDGPNGDPRLYSESLYLAVICHDYPELWSPSTPISQRPAEVRSALAGYPAGTFAPFSAAAWTGTDFEGALACLRWPSPARPDPPAPPSAAVSAGADADPERRPRQHHAARRRDASSPAASRGARSSTSRTPATSRRSSTRTTAPRSSTCTSSRRSAPGDTSCAHRTPEVRVVPAFARSAVGGRAGARRAARRVDAARPAGGRGGGRDGGRRAAALVGQLRRHGRRPARRPVVVLRAGI